MLCLVCALTGRLVFLRLHGTATGKLGAVTGVMLGCYICPDCHTQPWVLS